MKADSELIDYLRKRYLLKKRMQEEAKPNGPDSFRHILFIGEASAFREILMLLGANVEDSDE